MRRGSTPTFCFTLPKEAESFSDIRITFVQNGTSILTAEKNELELRGKDALYLMSEENSLKFSDGQNAELQIRLVSSDGTVLLSEIKQFAVRKKHPFE